MRALIVENAMEVAQMDESEGNGLYWHHAGNLSHKHFAYMGIMGIINRCYILMNFQAKPMKNFTFCLY